jgi:hypothetical protein
MMLLTNREREFLAVFIREATTDPFRGPATDELHRHDIYYTDLSNLLAAYYRECSNDDPESAGAPACPWPDREAAAKRDREIGFELGETAPPKTNPAEVT